MTRPDRDLDRRRRAEAVAHHTAEKAHGLFLPADDVADLYYALRHGHSDLAWRVERLLERVGPVELRPAHPYDPPLRLAEVSERMRCSKCDGPSFEIGGGFNACRRCGHGWLMVRPDDVALDTDTA